MEDQKQLIDEVLKKNKCLLIVLDAVNYDYFVRWFRQHHPKIVENIKPVRSRGTRTREWVTETFKKEKYDAVYVSGNPFINNMGVTDAGKAAKKCFKRIVEAWKTWDNRDFTCRAETVNQYALWNINEPNLVVHYMQPHQPYIGDYRLPDTFYYSAPWYMMKPQHHPPPIRQISGATVKHFTEGDKDLVRHAYYSNLDYVCRNMLDLIKQRDNGWIAVTADHSELMGENNRWFHWGNHEELRKVPWICYEKQQTDEDIVMERLRQLGYVD